jgi:phenylacetate-CoA ligase
MNPITKGKITFEIWRARRATRSQIDIQQRRRLENILSFVRRQSRFYKQHYADIPDEVTNLEAFPPVTKSMLMENFDDVVTDTAVTKAEIDEFVADEATIGTRFLDRYPVWVTSGTTGEPGIFVQDDTSLIVLNVVPDRWTLPALLGVKQLSRIVENGIRGAEIAVTGGHFTGASGVALMRRESTFYRNRIQMFSPMQPISDLVNKLNRFQPTYLVGYSTVLVELAQAQRDGRLDLNPVFIAPTAEPISGPEKHELARAFDCAVREIYGATEFFPIAVECEHGNLHANTDWVVLEPVDEEYQPVEPGEPSDTVLITNLANRIQPLVRYDLGDSITLYEERCPCGSAFPIIEVEGRQGDVLRFETDDGEEVPIFPLPLSSVVEEVSGVHRTQIVRTAPATLQVRIEGTSDTIERDVWTQVEQNLHSFLRNEGISGVAIEAASEAPQRDTRSEKFRHVWSELER